MRAQWWDYGWNGSYFITICTQNRENYFGGIIKNQLELNELGTIAKEIWEEIPNQFPFVKLGEFVIMPNHVHGILTIDKKYILESSTQTQPQTPTETRLIASPLYNETESQTKGGFAGEKNPMFHQNISRIIRWYKGRCSFEMRKISKNFQWQSGYHDHIIKNQIAYNNITVYIQNNPVNWIKDILIKQNSI